MKLRAKRPQAICRDTERKRSLNTTLNATINHLPGEVLLEIFDFYRQSIDPYDHHWRKKYVWFNLAHVSRKWRAVMLASCSRLDLGIIMGPEKPDHIKTILSGPMSIFIDYNHMHGEINESALWRMRATLRHHDRVREITFEGTSVNFDMFFKRTKCAFPVLESLAFCFGYVSERKLPDIKLPDAFLGPDPSDPHLRRLRLENVSLASISGFLLSATALTDLFLRIDTAFGPSPETSLPSCLQGMPCLHSLDLSILRSPLDSSQPSTPEDIIPFQVPLSKLIRFRYNGKRIFLNALSGISAQALQDVDIQFIDTIWPPIVHLPRFIDEMKGHYYAVHVAFRGGSSHLSLQTQSEYISHCKPRLNLGSRYRSVESTMRMIGALSARLSTVENLRITFDRSEAYYLQQIIPWRMFFQQFSCVKALQTDGADDPCIARILLQCRGPACLPALEELELGENANLSFFNHKERQTRSLRSALLAQESVTRARMKAIQPFISARQLAGCPVKVSIRTPVMDRNWFY